MWSRFCVGLLLTAALICNCAGSAEDNLQTLYREYLCEHGKDTSRAGDTRRFEQFAKNWRLVESHNDRVGPRGSFYLRMNHLADHLPEELSGMFVQHERMHETSAVGHEQSVKWVLPDVFRSALSIMMLFRFPWDQIKTTAVVANLPTSLDWSGANNPLGASVMSAVRNQVKHLVSHCSVAVVCTCYVQHLSVFAGRH
jgi:hypothetical protein